MASREDSDVDDDFSDLYKEYTGPPRPNTTTLPETSKTSKRSHAGSDEEEGTLDPNAVPTGFTSREAKVWEEKSKATERNWKKRKEEEMICKICGESSHFTQGCPSTLGASRKSQDLFERVPARDPQVRALFTERVIRKIEKDFGCKIKMEEKFIIVSGKDGQILSKGVDAVHKIKNDGDKKGESNSEIDKSRSPKVRSPVASRMSHSDSQRSIPSPRNPSHYNQRSGPSGRQEKAVEDHVREEFQKYPRGSPQARAYGNDGVRGRSTHSKSPAPPPYSSGSYDLNDNHSQNRGLHRNEGRDADKRGPDLQSTHKGSYSTFPQSLEELELEYKRNAMDIAKIRYKEEDDENYRHREAVREIRESHMKNLAMIREMHAKQWEEFLQDDRIRREQQAHQQMAANSGFSGGYKHNNYHEYGNPYTNIMPMDSRERYPELDNYPLRPNNSYDDFQRQRHEDYGKTFNRY